MEYAKINRDLTDTGQRCRNIIPVPPDQLAPGKPYWVPVVDIINDTSTGPYKVSEPRVDDIVNDGQIATEFRRTTTIRDKTQGEQDAEDESAAASVLTASGTDRALAQVCFQQENRLRALEGAQPVTVAQFKDALKGLIRG